MNPIYGPYNDKIHFPNLVFIYENSIIFKIKAFRV